MAKALIKEKTRGIFYGYIIVLTVFIILVVTWGAIYSFGVFLKPVARQFNWTIAITSGAYSFYMITHGLLYVVAGRFNDRFGPRAIVTVCGLFLGVGYLLMSQVSTVWQLYLYYGVVISIGMSSFFIPLLSTVARWFVKSRGLMTGVAVSGIGTGTMIMPPIANWLITRYGWRTSYVVIGIAAIVVTVIAAQFLKSDPASVGLLPYDKQAEVKAEHKSREIANYTFRQALRTRQFWLYFFMYAAFNFGVQTVIVHIVANAISLKIPATIAATVLTVVGGASIAGRLLLGTAGDRFGSRRILVICFVIAIGTLSWLSRMDRLWMLYLFAAVFGFAYGGEVALGSPMVAELFGMGSHGTIYGAATFGATIGGAIGPEAAGHIFDTNGNYRLAFVICALVAVVGLVLCLLLRPGVKRSRVIEEAT